MTFDKNTIEFVPKPSHPNFKDLEGRRFGRLIVLGYAGYTGRSAWWVECDCGNVKKVPSATLIDGRCTSCGCYRRETTTAYNTTHGLSKKHPLYHTWLDIRDRCNNPHKSAYKNYGGRGIQVCERWDDFTLFLEDMGEKPTPAHSIERIDVNGHYEPSNCKWADRAEQAHNKRNNHNLTYQGETKTLTEWSRLLGIARRSIRYRLERGWGVEKALSTPPRRWN